MKQKSIKDEELKIETLQKYYHRNLHILYPFKCFRAKSHHEQHFNVLRGLELIQTVF